MWLLAAALVVLAIVVYAPVRHYDYVELDDPLYVRDNPHVSQGLTADSVHWALTAVHGGYWIPLTWLSYMADVDLFGPQPGGHHVTNVLLHAGSTLLLFVTFRRMTGALAAPALVAALFAVHPLHVESVAWITERKDVLSTFFFMLTLFAYVRYTEMRIAHPAPRTSHLALRTPHVAPRTPHSALRTAHSAPRTPHFALRTAHFALRTAHFWYLLVVVCFALGLMAKPMLVSLPLVLLLLDVWPLERVDRPDVRTSGRADVGLRAAWPLVREKLPMLALALAASIVVFVTQRHAGAASDLATMPVALRLENAMVSCVGYLTRTVWPVGLAAYYPLPEALLPWWQVAGAGLVLVSASAAVLRARRSMPYLAVGWFWFLVTLLPVIGLVQVGVQGAADRFTYIPLIGLFIAIAWSVRRYLGTPIGGAVAIAIVLALAVSARTQLAYWKDSVAMWTRVAQVTLGMNSYRAHMELGNALRGHGRLDEAVEHFSEAARLNPRAADARYQLALALANKGDLPAAAESFREALRLKPDFGRAHADLGLALAGMGRTEEAMTEYAEALRLQPDLADTHNNLGTALAQQGRMQDALTHFTDAVRLDPRLEPAHVNRGLALLAFGARADALREMNDALRLNPRNPVARRVVDELNRAGVR